MHSGNPKTTCGKRKSQSQNDKSPEIIDQAVLGIQIVPVSPRSCAVSKKVLFQNEVQPFPAGSPRKHTSGQDVARQILEEQKCQ
jgi:hypothetical protein